MKFLKNKKTIVCIVLCLSFTAVLLLFKFGIIEYSYQRLLMANNPTTFFSCDQFKNKSDLENILNNKDDKKIRELIAFLSKNDGDIEIREVGNRCPDKFEFIVSFGSDEQRIEIEKILENQTLDNIPVFLLNR